MNFNVTIDHKGILALGASVVVSILFYKMDPENAAKVSMLFVDTCKELAIASQGDC